MIVTALLDFHIKSQPKIVYLFHPYFVQNLNFSLGAPNYESPSVIDLSLTFHSSSQSGVSPVHVLLKLLRRFINGLERTTPYVTVLSSFEQEQKYPKHANKEPNMTRITSQNPEKENLVESSHSWFNNDFVTCLNDSNIRTNFIRETSMSYNCNDEPKYSQLFIQLFCR